MKTIYVYDTQARRYVRPGSTREDRIEMIRSIAGIGVIFVTVVALLFAF